MTHFDRDFPRAAAAGDMALDAGLRRFMIGVYNKVALGLVLSGAIAYATAGVPAVRDLLFVVDAAGSLRGMTVLGLIVAFAPLVILRRATFTLRNASPRSSGLLYWSIVGLIGASLGVLALTCTGQSIATTFFVTAAGFGARPSRSSIARASPPFASRRPPAPTVNRVTWAVEDGMGW